MSDRKCNHCMYEDLKRYAAKRDQVIVAEPGELDSEGKLPPGTTVYMHPRESQLNRDTHYQCWFMELPDHCCC